MTTATPAEYGAAYLDEHHPDWAQKINLATLDIGCRYRCVLGQVFAKKSQHKSGYSWFADQHADDLITRLGFDVDADIPADLVAEAFDCLTAEWSELVAARQTQTSPQEVLA